MTTATCEMVQESWDAVLGRGTGAAEAFYERLLDIDPQLGRLFRGTDMGEQGRTLMRALTAIVRRGRHLRAVGTPLPAESWESTHLMVVGSALFALLEHGLGVAFTSPLRAAWMDVFAANAAEIRAAALGGVGSSRVVPLERRRELVASGG
jgi:hemoglobin-like flavoprotein